MAKGVISVTLDKFARSREAAYLQYGRLTGARARAISAIRRVADLYSQKSEQVQLDAVKGIESELRLILPREDSRYKRLRNEILDLIRRSKSFTNGKETNSPEPYGRSPQTSKGSHGTQLSFI